MPKVWFVTGAGKGIGQAIARAAIEAGDCVVITSRKEIAPYTPAEDSDRALYLKLDITEPSEQIYQQAVDAALAKFGRIDVLVNNAGHGRITNFEETSEENIREIFEVNLFGMMRMTRAVLPVMRLQRGGHIFNISSGAGYSAGPTAYHTSKFAVTGFSTCLAFELEPFGIKVTNVVPGLTRTGFYDRGTLPTEPDVLIDDYTPFRWQTDFMKANSNHEQPGDPEKIARLIVEVSACSTPPLHLPVTPDAVEVLDGLAQKLREDKEMWKDKACATTF